MGYIFWLFVSIIFYIYIGYPLVLRMANFTGQITKKENITPHVTLFIPAHNEQKVIREKIENSLALDYPTDKFEVIVASDGSGDSTASIVKDFIERGVILFETKERRGKNFSINEFIPRCHGEIIVFTDANSFFEPDAIRHLVRNFGDKSVGCVVGNLRYTDEETSVGQGEGLYFRYESMIKELESRYGTLVAATGSIYAIRKTLFTPLDLDVANDFADPIQIAAKGYKILFEPEAIAYEKATSSTADEFKRRARIVTRGMTAFVRYWRSYHMFKGMWGFCFISHKLLRWFIPFFLIAIFLSNLLLHSIFFRFTLYSQFVFYSIALIGIPFNRRLGRPFVVPYYFCVINAAAFVGILKYLSGKRESIWEVAKTTR